VIFNGSLPPAGPFYEKCPCRLKTNGRDRAKQKFERENLG
jgi:hypothetical protein